MCAKTGGAVSGVALGAPMGTAGGVVSKSAKPKSQPATPDNSKLFEVEELNADDIITVKKSAKKEEKKDDAVLKENLTVKKPTEAQKTIDDIVQARADAIGKSKEELLEVKPLEVVDYNVVKVEDKTDSHQNVDVNNKADDSQNPNILYQALDIDRAKTPQHSLEVFDNLVKSDAFSVVRRKGSDIGLLYSSKIDDDNLVSVFDAAKELSGNVNIYSVFDASFESRLVNDVLSKSGLNISESKISVRFDEIMKVAKKHTEIDSKSLVHLLSNNLDGFEFKGVSEGRFVFDRKFADGTISAVFDYQKNNDLLVLKTIYSNTSKLPSALASVKTPRAWHSLSATTRVSLPDKTIPQTTQTVKGSVRGMFENYGDKGVITLFSNSDMTTVFHESAHYIETTFTKEERAAFDEAFGTHEAGRARSEAFAEGFVKWAATGEAKNTTIARVFEKTREFLREVLSSLMNSKEAKFKLTPQQEFFYRAVFGDEEAKVYFAKALEKREASKPKDTGVKPPRILYQDGESLSVEVVNGEFLKFASKALNDGGFEASFNLGVIDKTSADKIYKFTNGLINLSGYTREIKASEVRHIKNRHSEDLKYMGEILNVLDNFEFAKATSYKEKTGRTISGVMLYMRHPDRVLVGVELRDFGNKKVELKTFYMGDEAKIARDQELPLFLRLWTNEDYRSKNPLPYRPDTHSDGFMDKSISQDTRLFQEGVQEDGGFKLPNAMPIYNFLSDFLRAQGKVGAVTKEALAKVHADKLYEAMSRHFVYGGNRADDVIDAFSAYKIEQSARGNKSTEVYKHLQKLSKKDRENLHLVLSGDKEISTLNPSLENTYKALRNIISQNAKELIELGELKADDSIEHYLARTYQKDVKEASSLQNSIFSNGGSVDHIKARRGKEAIVNVGSDRANDHKIGDLIARKNDDILYIVDDITYNVDGGAKLTLRRDYTFDERTQMGEIRDAAFSVWYTFQKQNSQIIRAKLLSKIPTKAFDSEEAAKAAGFEKVPDEATADRFKLYSSLGGKYISAADKADLDYYLNISHASGVAASVFGWVNAWTKGVTLNFTF